MWISIDSFILIQGIKALPVIVQKLWRRLKFLWRTDRRTDGLTDEWDLMSPRFRESGGQLQTYGQKDDPSHKSFKVSLLHVQFVFMCWLYDIVICSSSTGRMNRFCLTNKIRNIFHHLSMYCSSCMSWKLSKSHRPLLRSFYCYLNRRDLREGISTHTTRQDGQEHFTWATSSRTKVRTKVTKVKAAT